MGALILPGRRPLTAEIAGNGPIREDCSRKTPQVYSFNTADGAVLQKCAAVLASPGWIGLRNPLLAAQFGVCLKDVGSRRVVETIPAAVSVAQPGHYGVSECLA